MCPPRKGAFPMPYYKNGMKAAFSIVLLLTKIQKGFIKFLEPADCGMFCPNSIAVVRYGALIRAKSPTNCDIHLAESLFQIYFRMAMNISENICIYKFGGGYLLFSIALLLTKNQKGFIKSLEPADCRNDFSNTL